MTALFVNLKIDKKEKFDLFKVTISDIEGLFEECHIKIRGKFSKDCVTFAKELFSSRANFYQEFQEKDWTSATLQMLKNVQSRSIFFYLEDHKLTTNKNNLSKVLQEFDKYELDYLCYSFFRASRLDIKNLLPLNPQQDQNFSSFKLNKQNIEVIRNISPLYYTFSLASICSTNYFKALLKIEDKKYKIFFKKISSLLTILFPYPKYKIIFNWINFLLSFFNLRLCLFPIDTPFNMEKLNLENNSLELNSIQKEWKIGIVKFELFANFDDDNNAYGESLIKRGLYPFNSNIEVKKELDNVVSFEVNLKKGEYYDCSYHSQIHRINILPRVFLKINNGKVKVNYLNQELILNQGDYRGFFTNLSPKINCLDDAEILISVYDECLR